MTTWVTVFGLAITTFITKAVGPLFLGARELPAPLARLARMLAPALLAALVAVDTFGGSGRSVTVDARAAGLVAAAAALALRANVLVVVLCAAGATAGVRLIT